VLLTNCNMREYKGLVMHKSTKIRLIISATLFIVGGLVMYWSFRQLVSGNLGPGAMIGFIFLVFFFGLLPVTFGVLLQLRKRKRK
jgi:hypothetical protein